MFLLPLLLVAGLPSCATRQIELDLSTYPDLPSAPVTHLMRHVVERSDYLRRRALWGNYGGPGCCGGRPIDAMDALFRQHDLAYLQGVKHSELVEADRELIAALEQLDPAGLSPQAAAYRERAIRYFSRPMSRVVGKPPDVLLGLKTAPVVIDTSGK